MTTAPYLLPYEVKSIIFYVKNIDKNNYIIIINIIIISSELIIPLTSLDGNICFGDLSSHSIDGFCQCINSILK